MDFLILMVLLAPAFSLVFSKYVRDKTVNESAAALSTTIFPTSVTVNYCNRSNFDEAFQSKDGPVPPTVVARMRNTCTADRCRKSIAYPFWTFEGDIEEDIVNSKYSFGVMNVYKDDECWYYLFELKSSKQNRTIMRRYYSYDMNVTNTTLMFKEYGRLTEEYYGDRFEATMTVFPSGKEINYPYPLPENYCQLLVVFITRKYYWDNFDNEGCPRFYDQKNIFGVARQFCNHYKNPENAFVEKNLRKHLMKSFCTIYLDLPDSDPSGVTKNEKYLWIALSFLTIFVFSVISYKCFMSRKRGSNRQLLLNTSSQLSPTHGQLTLPTDSKISVMVLHRPGCDILDRLVRDFSFVIQSYGFEVTSPLLEMSQIDAEGGIATYIQRNIDKCTYILVIVTDNVTEIVHRNHKPFDFSIKILSGLAFRSNECSRYIPIYFKDYKDIIKDIPSFLSASTNCGYKIPNQIKDLVMYMMQTEVLDQDKNSSKKLSFFLEKIKAQVKTLLTDKHLNCCKGQCQQGTISDDISELWPTESSVTTNRMFHDGHSMSCMSSLLPVREQADIPLQDNILCIDLTEEEKVKQWQERSVPCSPVHDCMTMESTIYCVDYANTK